MKSYIKIKIVGIKSTNPQDNEKETFKYFDHANLYKDVMKYIRNLRRNPQISSINLYYKSKNLRLFRKIAEEIQKFGLLEPVRDPVAIGPSIHMYMTSDPDDQDNDNYPGVMGPTTVKKPKVIEGLFVVFVIILVYLSLMSITSKSKKDTSQPKQPVKEQSYTPAQQDDSQGTYERVGGRNE